MFDPGLHKACYSQRITVLPEAQWKTSMFENNKRDTVQPSFFLSDLYFLNFNFISLPSKLDAG